MSLFSSLKKLFRNKGVRGETEEAVVKGQRPEAKAASAETILKPKLSQREVEGKASGAVVRKPLPELSAIEIAEQGAWQAKEIRVWQPGEVILDTYKVEDVKAGGMGYVYIAEHQKWKVKMAIKTPNEDMLSDRSLFARVLEEADKWTDLGLHPHIAYCYYVRKIEDVPHIFIEYVDGGSLREWIVDVRCYDLRVGLDIAIQFCHGMEYAHGFGMIHRDIKPENILMSKEGMVKVTDFGIARGGVVEENGSSGNGDGVRKKAEGIGKREANLTTFGTRMGTYDYMSPEQYENPHDVDKRADIFSFGVCLYEMLCGRKPYDSASKVAASFLAKTENRPPHEPSSLRKDIPNELARLLKKCCALKKNGRYASFKDLRTELVKIYHGLPANPAHEDPPHAEVKVIELKADGLNNRAVSYLDLGRERDAIKCWQEALKEDRQHLEATFNYGYLRWQKAEILSDVYLIQIKALEGSKGSDPDYWRLLAWIHLERGDIDEVERIQNSEHRIEDEGFLKAYQDKNRPVGKLICTLEGHTDVVLSVNFSPDGHYALSGSTDIRLWDIERGKELRRFDGHTGNVTSVSFSPDSRYALSGSNDKTIRLWKVKSGKEIRRFEGHTDYGNPASFSPDGRYALSGKENYDKTIRLWDMESGREIRRFEGHTNNVTSVSFSPNGRYALSGSKDIRLWDIESGREIRRFEGHTGMITSVSFSPDGRYALSGSYDKTIRLWDMESGREIRRFEGHTENVTSVSFSPDGHYALSGSWDSTIRLWDIESGKELRRFEGHTKGVTSVSFSSDGRYAISGSEDKTIRLWEVYYPPKDWIVIYPYPLLSKVKDITQLSMESDKVKGLLKSAKDAIKEGFFHQGYTLLFEARTIHGYERDKEMLTLLTLCGIKGKGRRRGLKDAWHLRTLEGHTKNINSVSFSPDGRYALSGSGDISESGSGDYTIRLWDIESGREIRRFRGHTNKVESVCFSPDGRYALSASYDHTIRLWDIESGREIRRFVGHTDYVTSVSFSPDDRYALSGSQDKTIRLWNIESGREIRRFEGHTGMITSVSFSPDGRYALSGSGDISLWDIESGRELNRLEGHTRGVYSVSFSPDGRYAISGSEDKTIRLWEFDWDWEF